MTENNSELWLKRAFMEIIMEISNFAMDVEYSRKSIFRLR